MHVFALDPLNDGQRSISSLSLWCQPVRFGGRTLRRQSRVGAVDRTGRTVRPIAIRGEIGAFLRGNLTSGRLDRAKRNRLAVARAKTNLQTRLLPTLQSNCAEYRHDCHQHHLPVGRHSADKNQDLRARMWRGAVDVVAGERSPWPPASSARILRLSGGRHPWHFCISCIYMEYCGRICMHVACFCKRGGLVLQSFTRQVCGLESVK